MSERKAINKYYPPDYDPGLLSKVKKKHASQTTKIRMMAPYLMRCVKCKEYIAQRRSFNARKEVSGEKYLTTKIIRFHITCPRCNNPISFKTDPKLAGYIPEEGAVRNYEPAKKVILLETDDEILARLEREEQENKAFQVVKERRKRNPLWQKQEALNANSKDVMLALQDRLAEQQRQQEINDHLEELQAKTLRVADHGGVDALADMAQKSLAAEKLLEAQTEESSSAFKRRKEGIPSAKNSTAASTKIIVKRKAILGPLSASKNRGILNSQSQDAVASPRTRTNGPNLSLDDIATGEIEHPIEATKPLKDNVNASVILTFKLTLDGYGSSSDEDDT